jgi:hypothetical protein
VEIGFERAFAAAGGERRRESVPYPLTHARIRDMAVLRERILRLQFEEDEFSDADESVLRSLSLDDPDQCFIRWRHLVGMWHVWEHGLTRADAHREVTAHLLISRDPIYIRIGSGQARLSARIRQRVGHAIWRFVARLFRLPRPPAVPSRGRIVPVTSRSRAAMIALARHERWRKQLGQDLDRIEAMLTRRMPRRRRRALVRLSDAIGVEWEYQFRGVLANALSESGRAAVPEEAPEWWGEVSDADEGRLLLALLEAGPGRYDRLGKQPEPKKQGRDHRAEFGFESLLAAWEPKLGLPPAALQNHDLAQFLTLIRAGAVKGAEAKELEDAFG